MIVSPHTAFSTDHALRDDLVESSLVDCLSVRERVRRMSRVRIGIVFGGTSEEHHVSVKSAQEVAASLDPEKYEPFYVGITRDGSLAAVRRARPGLGERLRTARSCCRRTGARAGCSSWTVGRYETVGLDLVFPVLHGRSGEDGAIQGLLELSGIPYVGCDIPSSALCIDKSLTYLVARDAGIATPRFWTLDAPDKVAPEDLTYPVFVKPARSGSSFGVSKVDSGRGPAGARSRPHGSTTPRC